MDFSFLWRIGTYVLAGIFAILVGLVLNLAMIGWELFQTVNFYTFPLTGVNMVAILPYLELANYWFPLDHCFAAIVSLLGFWGIYSAVKITIKLIPFIG